MGACYMGKWRCGKRMNVKNNFRRLPSKSALIAFICSSKHPRYFLEETISKATRSFARSTRFFR
jgi:hypothetical protein